MDDDDPSYMFLLFAIITIAILTLVIFGLNEDVMLVWLDSVL